MSEQPGPAESEHKRQAEMAEQAYKDNERALELAWIILCPRQWSVLDKREAQARLAKLGIPALEAVLNAIRPIEPPMTAEQHNKFPRGRWS